MARESLKPQSPGPPARNQARRAQKALNSVLELPCVPLFSYPFPAVASYCPSTLFVVVSLGAQNQEASAPPAGHQESKKER